MKKIAIISPDTITLPLTEDTPEFINEGEKVFNLKDKCVKSIAIGKRAENFAKVLSIRFDVTVFVPSLNYPGEKYIDFSKLSFKIKPYDFYESQWKHSVSLHEELCQYDVVIIQTTTGVAFRNVTNLPQSIFVVVDGWVPMLVEYPASLSYYESNTINQNLYWSRFFQQYTELLKRANLVLYANERQRYYYEGQLFCLEKLNWQNIKETHLLKVPFGVEKHEKVYRKNKNGLDLLWYGSFYPWYDPNVIIEEFGNSQEVNIDFFGVKNPRYTNFFETCFNKEKASSYLNITINTDYSLKDPLELFSNYDACILITKPWLESNYSHRVRILEILSRGMPIITTEASNILEELPFMKDLVYEISIENLKEEILHIKKNKDSILYKEIESRVLDQLTSKLNWFNILTPLADILYYSN